MAVSTMTSRQRMLAALRRQPVDHVPCCPFFSRSLAGDQFTWEGRADTLERIVGDLGLDAVVPVGLEGSWHPDVVSRTWVERSGDGELDVLHRRIDTPAGPLSAAIRITEDLEHPTELPLVSDWNVSRYVKPWVESEEDLERLTYLYATPTDEAIASAETHYVAAQARAAAYGLATYASCGSGLTAALLLFGGSKAILTAMDRPDLIQRFLEIEHESTMRKLDVLTDWGVDIIRRNGFYETCDHWSLEMLSRWLAPLLREEDQAMRSGGAATVYTVCTGIMPMLDLLASLPFDCIQGIEPALGNQDMATVATALAEKSTWGGVSAPIHIGEGTPGTARRAVRDAFDLFGPTGLVLGAVPSIRAHFPWENSLAMFDEWKAIRG